MSKLTKSGFWSFYKKHKRRRRVLHSNESKCKEWKFLQNKHNNAKKQLICYDINSSKLESVNFLFLNVCFLGPMGISNLSKNQLFDVNIIKNDIENGVVLLYKQK